MSLSAPPVRPLTKLLHRKEKATAGVYSAGFNLGPALDIAADVYHGVRTTLYTTSPFCLTWS